MADRKKHHEQIKLTIFFKDPLTKVRISKVVSFLHSTFYSEVLEIAYKALEVESIAPIERFRLYEYDSVRDVTTVMLRTSPNASTLLNKDPERPIGFHWRSRNITFTRTGELLLKLNEEKNSFLDYYFFKINFKPPGEGPYENIFAIKGPCKTKLRLTKGSGKGIISEKSITKYKSELLRLANEENILVAVKQSGNRAFILEDTSSLTYEELSGSKVYVTKHSEDEENFIKTIEEELSFVWRLEFEFPAKLSSQICEADHSEALIDTYIFPDSNSSTSTTKTRTSKRTIYYNYGLKRKRLYFAAELKDKIYQSSVKNSENHLSEDGNTEDKGKEKANETVDEGKKSKKGSAQDEIQKNTEGSELPDSLKTLIIFVDNRTSVSEFLTKLQNFVNIQDRSVFHCSDETLSLNQAFKHNNHLQEKIKQFIKWGRVLYDDESEMKLFYLNLQDIHGPYRYFNLPLICEYLIRGSSEVGQTKREIIKHIQGLDKKYANLTFERTSLRLRRYFAPGKTLLDYKTFAQCSDYHKRNKNMDEIVIQKLESVETRLFDCEGRVIDDQSRLVTISRLLLPEAVTSRQRDLAIGKDCTIHSLKQAISRRTRVPENDIKYTIVKGRDFFFTNQSFLNELIDSEDLKSEEDLYEDFKRMMSGDVIIFKDKNEHTIEEEKSMLAFRRHFSAGR